MKVAGGIEAVEAENKQNKKIATQQSQPFDNPMSESGDFVAVAAFDNEVGGANTKTLTTKSAKFLAVPHLESRNRIGLILYRYKP
jgi:hypothetical protein